MAFNMAAPELPVARQAGAIYSDLCSYIACCSMCGPFDDPGIEALQLMVS